MKKGFTLIEIIISLIISAVIGIYILNQKQKSDFTSSVSKFTSTLIAMIQNGVIDSTFGYVSSSCDGDGDFEGITSEKVNDCVDWNSSYTLNGSGINSYFAGLNLLGAYTSDGKGCKIYFKDDSSDTQIFYLFVDCSNLSYEGGNKRYKKFVEDRVSYALESTFSTMYQSEDVNATAIDNDSGGNDKDGMIRIKFKK